MSKRFSRYFRFLHFARLCSNTVKVRWKTCNIYVYSFLGNLSAKEFFFKCQVYCFLLDTSEYAAFYLQHQLPVLSIGGEIWHGGGDRAKFHPHRCNVSPLRGENPQNRPLSKLNNRHFALRAMLPVNNTCYIFSEIWDLQSSQPAGHIHASLSVFILALFDRPYTISYQRFIITTSVRLRLEPFLRYCQFYGVYNCTWLDLQKLA